LPAADFEFIKPTLRVPGKMSNTSPRIVILL
jgi:hypothetical protein